VKRPKIAIALGGGGARGCAHIGVLKTLEEAGIPFDMVAGTSIGAVVGSIFCMTGSALDVEAKFESFLKSNAYRRSGLDLFKRKEPAENFFGQVATQLKQRVVINVAQSKSSLVSGKRLQKAMDFLIPDGRIEKSKIPFYPVASNILTGEEVVFQEGDLRQVVSASASIPGFVPPYKLNGSLLVDGSVVCPIPVLPARQLGADIVIAIDVGQKLNDQPNLDNVIDVLFQTQHMTARHYHLQLLKEADIVIRPDVGLVHWSEFKLLKYMVEDGERVTQEALPELERIIKEKTSGWKQLFKAA